MTRYIVYHSACIYRQTCPVPKNAMKRKLCISILLLLIFQLMSCISIYQYVRDKRDRSYREGVELYNQNKVYRRPKTDLRLSLK